MDLARGRRGARHRFCIASAQDVRGAVCTAKDGCTRDSYLQMGSASERNGVWISSDIDGWFVGIGKGHYSEPLSRDSAVMRARRFCRESGSREIQVFDREGLLIDRLPS